MIRALQAIIVAFALTMLSACTIQLAPDYDQELVAGLDKANEETLTIFASLAGGSDKSDYDDYKERYSKAIGAFTALRQRAETRQLPPLTKRLEKVNFVSAACPQINDCVNTSPDAIQRVIENLKTLQNRHLNSGIPPDLVNGFETRHQTAIQQALFVERALER